MHTEHDSKDQCAFKKRYTKDVFIDISDAFKNECYESLRNLIQFGIFVHTTVELESLFEVKEIEHSHDSDAWLDESVKLIKRSSISELENNPIVKELISFFDQPC